MSAKFIFFQEIKVLNSALLKKYRGLVGIIDGIDPDENEYTGYSYSVYFPDKGVSVIFNETELEKTGRFLKYEDLYDGTYARVSSDGELLELHVVDKK